MKPKEEFNIYNSAYLAGLEERYRLDPESVTEEVRAFLQSWSPPGAEVTPLTAGNIRASVGVANLARAIRFHGYLDARLDPLGQNAPGDPSLQLEFHGLNEQDLRDLPADLVGGPLTHKANNAYQAINSLRQVYCSTCGYDYGQVHNPEERSWLRETAESGEFRVPLSTNDRIDLLKRLTQVEALEVFLHRNYKGKTRFSIEGVDMLVPVLDEIVGLAAHEEICVILIGMAHRGRLNVLAHVLKKPYAQIMAEFYDPHSRAAPWDEVGWTGDVKYHMGRRQPAEGEKVVDLVISMPSNPSHLEHINPVLTGMARAADIATDRPGKPRFFPKAVLPILIHGDASFTGQGIVAETLNMSRLPGYQVAGSIHIITDNQLGYTATNQELRSTENASDLARGFNIPILHTNADDPQACLEAARTAFAYRARFYKDFFIHLVGYRRHGHNEGDEPSFTQPRMYHVIRKHPTVRQQWAGHLVNSGDIGSQIAEEFFKEALSALQNVHANLKPDEALEETHPELPPPGAARRAETAVPLETLQALNLALLELPKRFHLNGKLQRLHRQRRQIFNNPKEATVDWAVAEQLALATILQDGIAIRLTGEDVARGTFSQRHAVFHDAETEKSYTPLQAIPQARASFEVHNSPLSEVGALSFEYGYNLIGRERLVIWEAQYGDFINVAQVVIDEFIASARAKWGHRPSLVLLLPHGNEGQGPDHSSARPERFLGLAAETNLRLAIPTTAAQYFHLLRRQAALLKIDPLPLIVLTPKGLLRHPRTASTPEALTVGGWQAVLPDGRLKNVNAVERLVLCCGRLYVDLLDSKAAEKDDKTAIVRLEQLYPFPEDVIVELLQGFPQLNSVLWTQEEPQNMGAWEFLRPRLQQAIDNRWPLHYLGRPASSSPAEGSSSQYAATQRVLVEAVFNPQAEGLYCDLIREEV